MIRRIQRTARGARRGLALAAVLTYYAAAIILAPAQRRTAAARARWLGRTCRSTLRALGVRVAAAGRPAVPAVIVANHVSYLDILVLAAQTPAVFVAKREVRGWPVFGWFARMAGTRFIDRTRRSDVARVAAEFAPALAAGVSVVLFLEGTSSDGRAVLPFKPSLLAPVVHARLSVVPAAIAYGVPPGCSAATEVCWWGDMTLTPHLLNLLSLPRVQASLGWGEPVPGASDRKELADRTRERVMIMHRRMRESGADPTAAALTPSIVSGPLT